MHSLTFDNSGFDFLIQQAGSGARVEATVVTNNRDVEEYWGVLEFGSRRGQRPWPNPRTRTALGQDGRVYSNQAVGGFVRKNEDLIFGFMEAEYSRVAGLPDHAALVSVVNRSADRLCGFLRTVVPVDSGAFRDSISYVKAV
jgi:hypothetical protein